MSNFWIKFISILEIVGGISGILFAIYLLIVSQHNLYSFLLYPIVFAICILCLSAGALLSRKKELGRKLSIVIQIIQIPKLVSVPLTFTISFGLDIYPYISVIGKTSKAGVDIKFLAFYQFLISLQNAPFGVGVSITSIIFLIILLRGLPESIVRETSGNDLPPEPDVFLKTDDQISE